MQDDKKSIGGKLFVDRKILDFFVNEGIVAVSISSPGFGNSQGNRDFSGPISQQAIKTVIHHFKNLPFHR